MMAEKKQAVFVRMPGIERCSPEMIQNYATAIQKTLQAHFDKEVVVLMMTDDIHFMTQADIINMIDTLENIIK